MMVRIRILHIWNTAGVASIIGKYMDRLFATESLVVHRKALDPYDLTTYGKLWDCGPKEFTLRTFVKAKGYDIVHVHYFYRIIPYMRILYPSKPIIMHFHGDDIRGKWEARRRYWKKADLVLYSTPDLREHDTPKNAVHVPNPVDTEIFHPLGMRPGPKQAFHISYNADLLAKELAGAHGLELTIHDRKKQGPIPYSQMPRILSQYEYYVEIKRDGSGNLCTTPSKTALEALACGVKVITWDGRVLENLPESNRPEKCAESVFALYQGLAC